MSLFIARKKDDFRNEDCIVQPNKDDQAHAAPTLRVNHKVNSKSHWTQTRNNLSHSRRKGDPREIITNKQTKYMKPELFNLQGSTYIKMEKKKVILWFKELNQNLKFFHIYCSCSIRTVYRGKRTILWFH